jgi:hypothetical protein
VTNQYITRTGGNPQRVVPAVTVCTRYDLSKPNRNSTGLNLTHAKGGESLLRRRLGVLHYDELLSLPSSASPPPGAFRPNYSHSTVRGPHQDSKGGYTDLTVETIGHEAKP